MRSMHLLNIFSAKLISIARAKIINANFDTNHEKRIRNRPHTRWDDDVQPAINVKKNGVSHQVPINTCS